MTRAAIAFAAAVAVFAASGTAFADKIGVAAAVTNDVQGIMGGAPKQLALGSEVFTNQRIRTGDASNAQLLFLDETSLSVGPKSEITLDRFVYNPNRGAGSVVLSPVPAGCTAVGVPAKLINCKGNARPSQAMDHFIDDKSG